MFKDKLVQLIFARKDLGMSKGKMSGQVAHGCVGLLMIDYKNKKNLYNSWYAQDQTKIILKVESLEEMQKIFDEYKLKYSIYMVMNVGNHQVENGEKTVIVFEPMTKSEADKISSNYKLF